MRFNLICRTAVCGLLLVVACIHRQQVKPAEQVITLFVSSAPTPAELARTASLVQSVRAMVPVIWLGTGRVRLEERTALLGAGALDVSLLAAAGVDAVICGPEWLELGTARLRQLADQARFWVLSANLEDSLGLPLCHPWMIKTVGGVRVGVTALLTDTADWRRYQAGIKLKPAGYAGKMVLGRLDGRADIKLLVLPVDESVPIANYDLMITSRHGMLTRYDLTLTGRRLTGVRKTEINLDEISPASAVQARLDSLLADDHAQSEQPVVETRVKIPPRSLRRVLLDGLLSLRLCDVIVYDTSRLVQDTIFPGMITINRLAQVLGEPGPWALVQLEGAQIRELGNSTGYRVEHRKNLPGNRLMAHKRYQVLMPVSLLRLHPEIYRSGYEFSPLPFFQYAADILQAQGKR